VGGQGRGKPELASVVLKFIMEAMHKLLKKRDCNQMRTSSHCLTTSHVVASDRQMLQAVGGSTCPAAFTA